MYKLSTNSERTVELEEGRRKNNVEKLMQTCYFMATEFGLEAYNDSF